LSTTLQSGAIAFLPHESLERDAPEKNGFTAKKDVVHFGIPTMERE
jgi:hypothetical protein